MNILLALQLMSCMMAFVLTMQLVLCPYEGKEFRTYNQSRWLHVVSMGLLVVQYTVQMLFEIRANNEVHGLTCNFFFYLPSNLLVFLSILTLQRIGHLKKRDIIPGIAIIGAGYITLLAGIFIKGGQYLSQANNICSYIFLLMIIIYILKVAKGYREITHKMDDYYGAPVEEYIKWMRNAIILMLSTFVWVPFTIFSVRILQFFGVIFWITQAYYVTKFLYFGRYAKIVEETDDTENATSQENDIIAAKDENEDDKQLEQKLAEWVEMKGFCDSETSIMKLATEIGTNRTFLSKYINNKLGKTFREWINDMRIEEAKRLLKDHQMSIDQVSTQCGFSTRKYFEQVFNSHEGVK